MVQICSGGMTRSPLRENLCATSASSERRMLREKAGASVKTLNAALELARHHSTIGGWSDTEVSELMIIPWALPASSRAATSATPVPKPPRALR